MVKVANGQSTKIIVPSDLQNLVTAGTVLSETFKEGKEVIDISFFFWYNMPLEKGVYYNDRFN